MSYAFKEDGTGFIGKDAVGRIEFDGNKATISSGNYTLPTKQYDEDTDELIDVPG
jgi:hypothetical protein